MRPAHQPLLSGRSRPESPALGDAGGDPEPCPAGRLAWLALLPVAALTIMALLWLAPPLSHIIFRVREYHFFAEIRQDRDFFDPEPVEETRFLIAAAAPILLAIALLFSAPVRRVIGRRDFEPAILGAQIACCAFVVVCVLHGYQLNAHLLPAPMTPTILPTWGIVLGLGIGVAATVAAARVPLPRLRSFSGRLERVTSHRLLVTGVIALLTLLWLLPGVFTDTNVSRATVLTQGHLPAQWSDYLGVLDGRTPLVDLRTGYTALLPLALEPLELLLGDHLAVFTSLMVALSLVALMATYRTFAIVTERVWAAVALYVPFLAISMYPYMEVGGERASNGNFFNMFPGRYLGPFLTLWLCVRAARSGRPPPWVIFLAAGLTLLNNFEFGVPCVVASAAAVWLGGSNRGVSGAERVRALAASAALGLGLALALVSAVTLIRASSLPDLGVLDYYSRFFAEQGFGLLPMPTLGVHLIVYLTFVAAILTAAARHASRYPDRVLTAALAFTGIFGLGVGSYYAGRSTPGQLVGVFPAWGLCVGVLGWAILLALLEARREGNPIRLLVLPALACWACVGAMLTTADHFPSPIHEVSRITSPGDGQLYDPRPDVRFVEANTTEGETVAVLDLLGSRVARRAGVSDFTPFPYPPGIVSTEQMDLVVDALKDNGGTKVFLDPYYDETSRYLARHGFVPVRRDQATNLTEWQLRRPS